MSRLLIGLDFGTDSVRALLVNEHGSEVAGSVRYYTRWSKKLYCDAAKNQFRQHPLDHLEAMESVLCDVLRGQDASKVVGIALDTTGSTPCAVDQYGMPLALHEEFFEDPDAMFLLWKDHTAVEEAEAINACAASWDGVDYRKYEGGIYSCEWFWSKILHVLRHNPAVRNAAYSFVEHCDWLTGVLCGNTNPLTMHRSQCIAGHKAMYHKEWGGLPPEEFLQAVDPLLSNLRSRLYQHTVTADVPSGTLAPEWAAKLGLSTSVIVGGTALDAHAGAIGACIAPGKLVKVLGTSTCDILVMPGLTRCVPGICGQVEGSVLPGMTGLEAGQGAFGDIYNWFKQFLGYAGEVSLAKLEEEAQKLPPGAGGIGALDWFNGRRNPYPDPHMQGMICGLTLGSSPAMVYRALVESTVLGSRAIQEHLQREQITISSVTATGGISQKSPFVMQMCADVLKVPVQVVKSTQSGALGSAMIAGVASGIFADFPAAQRALGTGFCKEYLPDPETGKMYDEIYQRYLKLGEFMKKFAGSC